MFYQIYIGEFSHIAVREFPPVFILPFPSREIDVAMPDCGNSPLARRFSCLFSRLPHFLLLSAAFLTTGASYRTSNFIVSAENSDTAREIAQTAEALRRELSRQWLNAELPSWSDPCPIQVSAADDLPASGRTSFVFVRAQPTDWRMTVQGPRQQILHSVLPHEIAHTVFATYFGRPLPRWVEEGICVTVEHRSTRRRLDRLAASVFRRGAGIELEKLFRMKHYPSEILPFYSQGYSLTRFLVQRGGEQKLIQFIEDGLDAGDWLAASRKHYGFQSLQELQRDWADWVLLSDV